MDFSFENLGTNTYLVYQMKDSDTMDSMSLGMLTNNSIPGFAEASFMQMDTVKYIKYNVSAKVSVKQLFSGPVNKKRLLGVFTGVIDAMLSAEEYMLDPASILLDTDYIFADVTTCETELVCLPVLNLKNENQDLSMFFKNILFTTQFDQTENCDHVAQLINYLNTNPVLVLADFKELLRTISGVQPQPKAQPVQQPVVQRASTPVQPVASPAPTPIPPMQKSASVASPVSASNAPAQNATAKNIPTPAAMNVPVAPAAPVAPTATAAPAAPAASGEKPMSWFYLMQHYNAENAAIYKAQQEAKKGKKAAPQANPVQQPKAAPAPNAGFAVPGKAAPAPNAGLAVPGKAAPAPNAGFAVPGKAAPAQTAYAAPNQQQPVAPKTVNPQPVAQPQPAAAPVQQQPVQQSARPISFGETTVLGGAVGETTVLGTSAAPTKNDPHLIRAKNNEKIPVNKPSFRIGKERSYVDYFIGDNTAISRSHANIVDHNGEYYIVDTNSTNHTYVNGVMVQPGTEVKLAHGDKIRLANEEFEFRMF